MFFRESIKTVSIVGGTVPTERGDADGVGVVAPQREAQRDGGLVLSRTQLLRARGGEALAGPV